MTLWDRTVGVPTGGRAAGGGGFYHLSFRSGSRAGGASASSGYDYVTRSDRYDTLEFDEAIYVESGNMPSWADEDAATYWDAADLYERANGRLYVSADFALPRDLPESDQIELARDFARDMTKDEHLPYTLAIHAGRDDDGHEHNPHAHLMFSERRNDGVERSRRPNQVRCWTALGTTGCGLLILMTVLWDQPAGVREALREGLHSLRMVRRVPAIRASATVVLLLLTIGGVWLRASTRAIPASEAGARNFLRWYEAQTPRAEWRSPTGVRIVAFTDYQCPFCATGIPIARRLAESLTSESHPVELVERDFPLDQSCNKHARSNLHSAACEAAAAVRIVRKHRGDESAKALAASLYTIGRTMSIDRVREELGAVGLLDEFEAQRDEVLKEVASDASVAAALGVTGTPTYVVNGVALKGGTSLLELAVRHELGRLQASPSVAVRTQ